MKDIKQMGFGTQCVHGTYKAKSGEPQVLPLVQSTTFRYDTSQELAELFDLQSATPFYTRIGSPTVDALGDKMALLEGGSAGIATSAGMAATFITVANLCQAGDNIISASNIYGGTYNLFAVSFKRFGITVNFVDQNASEEEILKLADENTKAIFAETLGNPALSILDFEKFSKISKKLGVPLIVDNTLATPALCRPIEHGADIVIHATTKYADGHATSVGGVIVESGKFDWRASDKFPMLSKPDESYHGLCFAEAFGNVAFVVRLRAVMLRDFGTTMSPMNAFLTLQGLQTLHIRMQRHSENALALANMLEKHEKVAWVKYPGLINDAYHALAQKYMPEGSSGVLTFSVKGGKSAGEKFIESLNLTSLEVHVGDIRTAVLHPSSTTHRQLSEQQQLSAGIDTGLIRVTVGLESIDDIIQDFNTALEQC
ncbi:MAG: O-acetylhomoserine aminocarboxypropyltransferase/cysteine synthase family protein [Eubacteriales bacterium]